MANKLRIAFLMGGQSSERDVSLASGQEVLNNLDPNRYDVTVFDPATDLSKLVAEAKNFDLALPILHGRYGEDGTIQGLLELLKIPYVGSGVMSSAMCMDKKMTKDIMRFHGLTVTTEMVGRKGQDPHILIKNAMEHYGFPMVVKPVAQGSSFGLTIAKSEAEAVKALRVAWELDDRAMVERFVKGRELTCAVLGNLKARALPPIEIKPAEGHVFFDYEAKYVPGQAEEICPAELSEKETNNVKNLALAAHRAMRCRGISRTDFIMDDRGILFILEVNTLPGMTNNSLVPKAAAAVGYSLPSLLDELIKLALERE
ncbi:MAG: D-alanine--D-alanine ligase [Deltaproteobacteria bacterium]|jgi:D-alanine-D-alanine ligase|nr:D-alanine--D-alanine ligase [Deltaproteobacteria bacterium]